MRKIFSEVLCLLLLFSVLTGCSKESEGDAETEAEDEEQVETEEENSEDSEDAEGDEDTETSDAEDEGAESEDSSSGESDSESEDTTYTLTDAVDKLKSMSPSDLGLEGTSMDIYTIYANEELVYVDDIPCCRLTVYKHSETAGTNVIEGMYLMSRDGQELYRLEISSNTVTQIEME